MLMIYIRATFVYCEYSGSSNKMYNTVPSLKAKPSRTVGLQINVMSSPIVHDAQNLDSTMELIRISHRYFVGERDVA
jgi:hypothetical protein